MSAEEKWWGNDGHTDSHWNHNRKGLDRLIEEHPVIGIPLTFVGIYAGAYVFCSAMNLIIDYFRK
jgi:hypothetical protein